LNKFDVYIGIDPSINSTGVTIMLVNPSTLRGIEEQYYIVKGNRLTKKEKAAEETLRNFEYLLYEKMDLKGTDEYKREKYKAINLTNIANTISINIQLLLDVWKVKYEDDYIGDIFCCMEGISYGSIHSSAVMDLAGLNYLIRSIIMKTVQYNLYVCPPTQIKMFATGVGNAKKEQMVESFVSIHPEMKQIPKNDDLADSYFMCKWMLNHNNIQLIEDKDFVESEIPF
jgi:Holliday junction resolvasome RuvABC endonuclease subunit